MKLVCLKEIKTWMVDNFLLLNSDKTQVIVFGLKHLRNTLSKDGIILNGIALASSYMAIRICPLIPTSNKLQGLSFFKQNTAELVHNALSCQKDAEKLVHAIVSSRLVETFPQLIQNTGVGFLTRTRKIDLIHPKFSTLHWLPVKPRIKSESPPHTQSL